MASQSDRWVQLHELLVELVGKHRPELLPLVKLIGLKPLSMEQREDLRSVVATELTESGLDINDEPTKRGLLLEELIDWLGDR
jgi:hypothetical protein